MYSWDTTSQIASDLERLEELRRVFDVGTLPRRWAGRLRRELEAESAAASTGMEGVPVTVEEVRRILAGDRTWADAETIGRQLWQILEDIATEDLGMSPRLADALYDAFFGREVTNRYYRGLADVSVATATNDLARLEAGGLVRAVGAGRSAAYVGTEALVAAVAGAARLGDVPTSSPLEAQRAWLVARLADRVRG